MRGAESLKCWDGGKRELVGARVAIGGEGGEESTPRMPDDVLWGLRYHGGRKVVEKRLGVRL